MTHPIPAAALDDRLGFVGTAGSGKTYNAGGCVEHLLSRKSRCIIIDPLDVWWGLRLASDGKTESPYRPVIFGGAHGDLPLNEHAGALVGETVAGMAESCIVSLGNLGTAAAERRFMLAFLTAIYRKASGEPVHLIFDEADMWAPQRVLDKEGDANKLLGQMETIVRRGRVRGFIPWLITQRPAVLSKNVLSQIDGLVAFKLTATQDRDAIGGWVEGQADKAEWNRLYGQLATFQRGHGLVWVPGRGILKDVDFPPKATFDSSATPKRGETKRSADLKPLNVEALRGKLATVEKEVTENDPRRLKQRIAELQRQVQQQKPAEPVLDQAALRQAEERGRLAGWAGGFQSGMARAGKLFADVAHHIDETCINYTALLTKIAREEAPAPAAARPPVRTAAPPPPKLLNSRATGAPPAKLNGHTGPGENMSKAERRVLTVLAQHGGSATKRKVALLAGYAIGGGGFNNALSSLRSAGRIEGSDPLRITEGGLSALGTYDELPHGDALLDHWRGQLGKAERAALDALVAAYPDALTKEQVAVTAGYEANGGGFNNALSRLRTLELIDGRGELTASAELFS